MTFIGQLDGTLFKICILITLWIGMIGVTKWMSSIQLHGGSPPISFRSEVASPVKAPRSFMGPRF